MLRKYGTQERQPGKNKLEVPKVQQTVYKEENADLNNESFNEINFDDEDCDLSSDNDGVEEDEIKEKLETSMRKHTGQYLHSQGSVMSGSNNPDSRIVTQNFQAPEQLTELNLHQRNKSLTNQNMDSKNKKPPTRNKNQSMWAAPHSGFDVT